MAFWGIQGSGRRGPTALCAPSRQLGRPLFSAAGSKSDAGPAAGQDYPFPHTPADPRTAEEGTAAQALVYTVVEAAAALRVSRSFVYEEIKAERLKAMKIGDRRLVRRQALVDYLDLVEEENDVERRWRR